jgi:hypothetical protein
MNVFATMQWIYMALFWTSCWAFPQMEVWWKSVLVAASGVIFFLCVVVWTLERREWEAQR